MEKNKFPYITTADNPFDPSVDYISWDAWDRKHGYNTSSYLSRVVQAIKESKNIEDINNNEDDSYYIDLAINSILQNDPTQIEYVKIFR